MIRNIILDWSGTVVDDLGAVVQATNDVFREFGRAEISREAFRAEFALPLSRFYERFLPGVPMERIEDVYHRQFQVRRGEVGLLPGVSEFLEFCRRSNRAVYGLSTMYGHHFNEQARRLNVQDYFLRVYVEVIDKATEIKRVLAENHLVPQETAFVGDMAHDIEAAKKSGVLSVGILTGFDTVDKLAPAGAALVIRGFGELEQLLGTPRHEQDEVYGISDQKVSAHIGVSEEERAKEQTLAITLRFQTFGRFQDLNDDLSKAVDYAAVASEMSRFVSESKYSLIETLVSRLADHLVRKFPLAYLEVELKKFVLPDTNHVSVRAVRRA
ncbi:MAG: dihydroneopterin aldolase [Verrucomicrobia bacterium]|nr:dihydroneopterin aldolase [Verrucomicrobiota bacterium]